MANISQELDVAWLEKRADGSYDKKNFETKASQVKTAGGGNLESHVSDSEKHGVYIDETTGDSYKWGISDGLVYLEKAVR